MVSGDKIEDFLGVPKPAVRSRGVHLGAGIAPVFILHIVKCEAVEKVVLDIPGTAELHKQRRDERKKWRGPMFTNKEGSGSGAHLVALRMTEADTRKRECHNACIRILPSLEASKHLPFYTVSIEYQK